MSTSNRVTFVILAFAMMAVAIAYPVSFTNNCHSPVNVWCRMKNET